jgi:hypothetical protein
MKLELAQKMLKCFEEGNDIYYYLEIDDYVGWIPVKIYVQEKVGDLKPGISFMSLSDVPRAHVFSHLNECNFHDFKIYKPIDITRYF